MEANAYPDDYPTTATILDGSANRDYRPTLSAGYINKKHQWFAEAPLVPGSVAIAYAVPGKLRPADAAKLYEMAYFSEGDVLELGTYKGLSSSIMGEAVHAAGKPFQVYTADLEAEFVSRANAAHKAMKNANVHTHIMDGGAFARSFAAQGRKFGFAFIDHWHGYDATAEVCKVLPDIMMDRSFVLFHDYTHIGNAIGDPDFRVVKAVEETLSKEFRFFGVFGCSALYRYEK